MIEHLIYAIFIGCKIVKVPIMKSPKSPVDKLLNTNPELTHSEQVKVTSHTQREVDDWIVHTIMIENHLVPFKFKRKGEYRSLTGSQVNITYYPVTEKIGGFEIETMKVVRIKRS